VTVISEAGDPERLLVFVRLPVPGHVKTRLAARVGAEGAAALYRCFVADILATVRASGYAVLVFFDPPQDRDAVVEWLSEQMTYLPQEGNGLGERMTAAFREAFRACSRAVLVGSDCPDLPGSLLTQAFESLTSHDAVLGPARDGGYYLVGFTKMGFLEAAFEGMEWGGQGVFEATMDVLRKHRRNVHTLPPWDDVDEYEDLEALCRRHKDLPPGRSVTVDYLREHLHW
jgi:uncharacterized protein